jgi:hypothetical protein
MAGDGELTAYDRGAPFRHATIVVQFLPDAVHRRAFAGRALRRSNAGG